MTTDAMTWVQFQPPVASFDFVRVHRRHCNGRRQRNEAFTMVCYVLLTLFHPQKKLDWIMFTGNSLKICQVDNVCISHWKMHPTKKKRKTISTCGPERLRPALMHRQCLSVRFPIQVFWVDVIFNLTAATQPFEKTTSFRKMFRSLFHE